MIRLVKLEDIDELSVIYKDLYDNISIGENWTLESSKKLLMYWYNKQKDLFLVAIENKHPVGAVVSGVKEWFDGIRLVDSEIFVAKEYQKKCIGKELMKEHLKIAKIKYNATKMEFHTYGDETEFPQLWYNRLGFKKDEELIIMNGNVDVILKSLGYDINDEVVYSSDLEDTNYKISYNDLSNRYENLKQNDIAYIFDTVPEYAYLDNLEEKNYLASRNKTISNNATVSLFIVIDENIIKRLKGNKLFIDTIKANYINKSKLYIINKEELRRECLYELCQLGNGLYYGELGNGNREAFRDLWENNDNLGIFIKDEEMLNFIEQTVHNIVDRINKKKIKLLNVNEVISMLNNDFK